MLDRIHCQRGQSLIEALMVMIVLCTGLFALLKLLVKFVMILALNDFLESYVLCAAYNGDQNCKPILVRRVAKIGLTADSIQLQINLNQYEAQLTATSKLNEKILLSRRYEKQ